MLFDGDVVVMAVDGLIGALKRRQVRRNGLQDQAHHFAPVRQRVILRPVHRLHVIIKVRGPFLQVRQVPVRQARMLTRHVVAREFNEIPPDGIANAPAA